MRYQQYLQNKIHTLDTLLRQVASWKATGQTIVFTNGCFDIIHPGHIANFTQAAAFGHKLVVAVNTDNSVRRQGKGPERPINNEEARLNVLAALIMIDALILFDEDTPLELIKVVQPNVLVKGGDYSLEQIVGSKEVIASGGKVEIIPIVEGFSTTNIVNKLK
jgi:D-glycero-beta-D-manno-heptose 1-phosphate adenylyltransferase